MGRKLKCIYSPAKYLLIGTALITLLLVSEVSADASTKTIHQVTDICMYVNRALKSYALWGMDVEFHNPEEELKTIIATLDKHFKELKSHKMNEKLTAEILEIEESWNAIKPAFEQKPEKDKARKLLKQIEKYTLRCYELAENLAEDSKIEGENYIILVARLGMESQRIAAEYLIHSWGVEDPLYEGEIDEITAGIEGILKELMNADEKLVSKEIKEKLKSVENDFIAFGVMAKSKTGHFMPAAAEKSADKIHEKIEEILHLTIESVEGNVSYFIPLADKQRAGESFREITEIIYVNGEIKS